MFLLWQAKVLARAMAPGPAWRLQCGNLGFFKDQRYSHAIVLFREDTQVVVLVTWKKGINNIPAEPVMLPGKVAWQLKVTMKDVELLKAAVKTAGGEPTPYKVDQLRHQQCAPVNDILSRPLDESFTAGRSRGRSSGCVSGRLVEQGLVCRAGSAQEVDDGGGVRSERFAQVMVAVHLK